MKAMGIKFKSWTFTADGKQGHAERYGLGKLQVFIVWAGIGCHLDGVIESVRDAVLKAEQ